MTTIYKILFIFCMITILCSTSQAGEKKHLILVSQDFTEVLAKSLTTGSSIDVIRAIPANYNPDTHTSYLKSHWNDFAALSQKADAVLTVTGSWPKDPLYPWARRANIRIVPIDISSPIDQSRAGIPLLDVPGSTKQLRSIWNSPGNCARMADITASDLIQLFPGQKELIAHNRDQLKQQLFKLRAKFETSFSELEHFEVISLTADYFYLTDEFGVSVMEFFLKPEYRWKDEDVLQLTNAISFSGVNCVIAKWEPKKEIQNGITNTGAKIIVPKSFSLRENISPTDQLLSFYETNLNILLKGLL